MNPIPTGPQAETTQGYTNPSGRYLSPEGDKTLIAVASRKIGNPVADALVQLGWTYQGPVQDGDIVSLQAEVQDSEEVKALRKQIADLQAQSKVADANVTVKSGSETTVKDDSAAVAVEIAAEQPKTTTKK